MIKTEFIQRFTFSRHYFLNVEALALDTNITVTDGQLCWSHISEATDQPLQCQPRCCMRSHYWNNLLRDAKMESVCKIYATQNTSLQLYNCNNHCSKTTRWIM